MLGLYLAAMDDSTYETQFVQVYERCKRLVYHTAYQIVQDSYLAEDVLQEVFLHLAQNFTRVYREDKHKMAAYLVYAQKAAQSICCGNEKAQQRTGTALNMKILRMMPPCRKMC